MRTFHNSWYVIYTRPNKERKIFSALTEMGIESLLPMQKSIRSWSDRKKCIEVPLFPSYVFVCLKDLQEYYHSLTIDGVLYYLRDGKDMAKVRNSTVTDIRIASSGSNEIEVSSSYFEVGRKIIVSRGALTGLSGEIVSHGGKEKLLVRVNLLRRYILLTLSEDDVLVQPAVSSFC